MQMYWSLRALRGSKYTGLRKYLHIVSNKMCLRMTGDAIVVLDNHWGSLGLSIPEEGNIAVSIPQVG